MATGREPARRVLADPYYRKSHLAREEKARGDKDNSIKMDILFCFDKDGINVNTVTPSLR